MIKLSIDDIISKIASGECFEAVSLDYSFTIKIEAYVPYVCAAIHDGHQFRKELWDNCLHTAYDRWYEEDPHTKEMIASHPIVIAGCDSRFEYDLNRAPDLAIYDDAWGKKLWKIPVSESVRTTSLNKHTNFYRVVDALLNKLEEIHKQCIVYDMHSYNWKRWDRPVPTWNIGTANVDQKRYKEAILSWQEALAKIALPNAIDTTSKINDTFQGNGYFLKHITANTSNTLVLATEIKKIYCDELTQVSYPEVIKAVANGLNHQIKLHSDKYSF